MKLPKKQEQVLKMLLKEGFINSREQIISIACFEYFRKSGFFDLIDEYFKKTKKEEVCKQREELK